MKKTDLITSMVILSFFTISIMQAYAASQTNLNIQVSGTITTADPGEEPQVTITVDTNKIVASNNLSLGTMIDWQWNSWRPLPLSAAVRAAPLWAAEH